MNYSGFLVTQLRVSTISDIVAVLLLAHVKKGIVGGKKGQQEHQHYFCN